MLSPALPSGGGPSKGHVVGDAATAVTHLLPNTSVAGRGGDARGSKRGHVLQKA